MTKICKKAMQDFPRAVSKVFDRVKSVALWSANIRKLAKDHKGYGSAVNTSNEKFHEARSFNFTYRYIDDVLSINNSRFAEFLPLIYPPELEVKETTDTSSSASFLDLYLEFDDSGQLSTKIYDKRDDFNFKIINFPNMCSSFSCIWCLHLTIDSLCKGQ